MMILNKLGYKTRKEKEADKRLKEYKRWKRKLKSQT